MPRPDPTPTPGRKADHLRIAAGPGIQHGAGAGLDAVRMRHRALPERDLGDVVLDCELLGARLRAPLLISAMTGGAAAATDINRRLAGAAEAHGVGLVLRLRPAAAGGPVAAAHLPGARAARGRRCCSPTSAPRRSAGRARPTARSGSSSCSAPTGSRSTSTPCRRPSSPRASRSSRACSTASRRSPSGSRPGPSWSRRSASGWTPRTSAGSPPPASRRSTSRARAGRTGR